MKNLKFCLLLLVLLCMLCACAQVDTAPTETTEPQTVVTDPVPETEETTPPETPPPTECPAVEVARELITSGDYEAALATLEDAEGEEAELLRLRAAMGDVKAGDQLLLGSYEQDNDTENGSEPITWVVLAVQDDKAFLLSLSCLDTQPYHDVLDGRTTWADSTLRKWLNEEFFNAAFSGTEQMLVAEMEITNPDSRKYQTPGGENTLDRVFLLSLDEAAEYLTDDLKRAHVTEYAAGQGCYLNGSKNGWWWLRSPGVYSRDAAYIDAVGKTFEYGYIIHRVGWAVRPAMWIDLSV